MANNDVILRLVVDSDTANAAIAKMQLQIREMQRQLATPQKIPKPEIPTTDIDKLAQSAQKAEQKIRGVFDTMVQQFLNGKISAGQFREAIDKLGTNAIGVAQRIAAEYRQLPEEIQRAVNAVNSKELRPKINKGSIKQGIGDVFLGNTQGGALASELGSIAGISGTATVALGAAAGGALALAAGLKQATELAIRFDDALNNVRKVSNLNRDEIKLLGDDLLALSKRGLGTPTELADAAANVASSGIAQTRAEIAQMTAVVAKFSVATNVGFAQSADDLSKIALAFKEPIANIERIGSVINEAEAISSAKVPDIISVLREVGATAAPLGLTADQVAAIGATAISAGVQVSDTGTSLRNFFTILQTDADKVAKAIGVPVKAFTELVQRDAIGAMDLLFKKLKSADQISRTSVIESLFGKENITTIQTLVSQSDTLTVSLDKLHGAYTDNVSLSNEVAIKNESLSGQWRIFNANIEVLGTELGTVFLPILNSILQAVNFLFFGVDNTSGGIETMGKQTSATTSFMRDMGNVVDGLKQAFGFLTAVAVPYNSALFIMESQTPKSKQATGDFDIALRTLRTSLLNSLGPLGTVIDYYQQMADVQNAAADAARRLAEEQKPRKQNVTIADLNVQLGVGVGTKAVGSSLANAPKPATVTGGLNVPETEAQRAQRVARNKAEQEQDRANRAAHNAAVAAQNRAEQDRKRLEDERARIHAQLQLDLAKSDQQRERLQLTAWYNERKKVVVAKSQDEADLEIVYRQKQAEIQARYQLEVDRAAAQRGAREDAIHIARLRLQGATEEEVLENKIGVLRQTQTNTEVELALAKTGVERKKDLEERLAEVNFQIIESELALTAATRDNLAEKKALQEEEFELDQERLRNKGATLIRLQFFGKTGAANERQVLESGFNLNLLQGQLGRVQGQIKGFDGTGLTNNARERSLNELRTKAAAIERQITEEQQRQADARVAIAQHEADEKLRLIEDDRNRRLKIYEEIARAVGTLAQVAAHFAEQQQAAARKRLKTEQEATSKGLDEEEKRRTEYAFTERGRAEVHEEFAALRAQKEAEVQAKFRAETIRLFNIQKAVSIAEAIANTAVGITRAYALHGAAGIPEGIALGVLGALQIAKIASTEPPAFYRGGLVGGGERTIRVNEAGPEFVMNHAATRQYAPILQEMNAGRGINVGDEGLREELSAMRGDFRYLAARLERMGARPLTVDATARIERYETSVMVAEGNNYMKRNTI